ncbi:TIGR02269 family lipoprotein [Archangium minus]|uniref:SitA6 family polymorphic toxin lipoprotein n=1 Tax=Archangium minus TaxID=83450 RepID=UPI0037BE3C9F
MSFLRSRVGLALLGVLLCACASSAPTGREEAQAPEVVSSAWEEARADATCVVPLCDEERCAIWRCQDVVEAEAPPVRLAQAMIPAPAPAPVPMFRTPLAEAPSASRWWGHPLAVPTRVEPVFEIPWHNWKTRELSAPRLFRHQCLSPPREPFEKHHIFPQQKELAEWFGSRGIDIHAFTIRLPRSFHQWLHSGEPRGGQWNEAWRQFMRKNRTTANADDIWRFAGELMIRFGVNGSFVPYSCD